MSGAGGFGFVEDGRTLPFDERFFVGGSNSIRGFERNMIGPANYSQRPNIDYPNQIEPFIEGTSLVDEPAQWIPTGGDYFGYLLTELHYPLSRFGNDKSSIVGFFDVAKVGFYSEDSNPDSVQAGLEPFLRYGVGFGLRFASPVGPVAIDIGFNPSPIPLRNEDWFEFHPSFGAF